MYLRRLELQGFKTFAQKTALEFHPQSKARRGLTGVVGPNGSGKSNIADAIRWVMGEQSMKLLRGKKGEDVIFSGSTKKARSGFAEVSLTLVNDDKPDIELSEIVVTRRLYRDGKSEYEVNRQTAKHGEIVLLLAQAGIGQRTYSVIGQGMVDAVLVASPAERKEFFDEAAGLRPFQMKRHQATNRLETSKQNLGQAEALLREIGPRLSTLERQMKRLLERSSLEKERDDLERKYYGGGWHDIWGNLTKVQTDVERARVSASSLTNDAKTLEAELAEMEKAVPPSKEFDQLRTSLDAIAEQRANLREKQAKLHAQVEIARAKGDKAWAALPLSKIIESVEESQKKLNELWKIVESAKPDLERMKSLVGDLRTRHESLVSKLQQPAPEPASKTDPKIVKDLEDVATQMGELMKRAASVQTELDGWSKKEEGKRAHLFETQRKLNQKRTEAQQAERRANESAVDLARWETRRDAFLVELRQHHPDWEKTLNALAQEVGKVDGTDALFPRLTKVRSQLEWIGSIDPETEKEHAETKKRFDFLSTQTADLKGAISGLETVIEELDETIRTRSETAFHAMDREFGKFFKLLFSGGEAKLLQLDAEPEEDEEGNVVEQEARKSGSQEVGGIEIQATPPGKRLKNIALLSGGERALTSIALICAIMATNPSPFVVLDEVDAALDEANSKKFADILSQLSDKTQFIVVTHNRATMQQGTVLYGVTLAEDGTSQLLSVKLEDVLK
ncbi:MAG TPA: AAA family ATPase [Candidatus Methylomirabilis sp.]|nr:AAA family ATPase [Candidatus Methylomirabilis sp.]